jgi:hypothetical protein
MVCAHRGEAAAEAADRRSCRADDEDLAQSALALSPEPGTFWPSAYS